MRHGKIMLAGGVLLTGLMLIQGCSPDHYSFRSARFSKASNDAHEYESTPLLPATVQLKEVHSGTVLWKYDIPAGSKLVVDYDTEGDIELASISGKPATSMKWWVYGTSRGEPTDKGEMALQGMPVIIELSYRPGPELPPGYVPVDAAGVAEAPYVPAEPATTEPQPLVPVNPGKDKTPLGY